MSGPQILITDVAMGESPRWHDGRLWFSDWGAEEVIAVDLEGNREVIVKGAASLPFCLERLPDGRLLIVSGQDGRVLRREHDGTVVTHADLSALMPEYPWNEIVLDGRGNAYVNNIGFDFGEGDPAPGIVALLTPDGESRIVADGVMFPNGMAVTPDDETLIVAESYAARLTAFDIEADGSLSNRRVWAALAEGAAPDGICLDAEGAVWYGSVPQQQCVRVREGGEILQTVELDRGCFACMLGGEDGTTLFMVANRYGDPESTERTGQVLTVQAPAPHAGRP
jgi:sugar lactone lactonase YvrE